MPPGTDPPLETAHWLMELTWALIRLLVVIAFMVTLPPHMPVAHRPSAARDQRPPSGGSPLIREEAAGTLQAAALLGHGWKRVICHQWWRMNGRDVHHT